MSKFLTRNEIASLLKRTPETISDWTTAGRFPSPTRIGGKLLWPEYVVESWIASHRPGLVRVQEVFPVGAPR